MKNKVLIKLIMPEFDQDFDIFIPVNELLWRVKRIIVKCVSDITNVELNPRDEYMLINKDDGRIYDNNEIVINTNIRNGSELILMSKK